MAEWIIHRPPKHSHPAEIRVAEVLKNLDDRWLVVWGYFYQDSRGNDREGDFLVLGPAGGLLVLEVKSKVPRHFGATGQWEGGETSPLDQLMDEWSAVRRRLKDRGCGIWVTKALCCPEDQAPHDIETYQGLPRHLLLLQNDLADWLPTWLRLFDDKVTQPMFPQLRRSVMQAFGEGSVPEAKRAFLDHTEQLFQRQLTTRFEVLDQLADNRHLLVRGGTGTGKTWHALEQAFRYAAACKNVLLLAYNLALVAQIKRLVAMRNAVGGTITVLGWEELFRELLTAAGAPMPVPAGRSTEEVRRFFEIELPATVLRLSRDPSARAKWPRFDALIVDEAQDHDTSWAQELGPSPSESGGWWDIYRMLLTDGGDAPASLFFDPSQRPPFRAPERFDPASLAAGWSQPALVRLHPAVRYTRPLWSFLRANRHEATGALIDALGKGDHLPEGPSPEVHTLHDPATARDLVEAILARWKRDGLCEPEEVLILHKQSDIARCPLGKCRVLAGRNLRECTETDVPGDTIRHTSINKAKGLDAKAVILLGLAPFTQITEPFEAYTWFMGASRARQLLAVLETPG